MIDHAEDRLGARNISSQLLLFKCWLQGVLTLQVDIVVCVMI